MDEYFQRILQHFRDAEEYIHIELTTKSVLNSIVCGAIAGSFFFLIFAGFIQSH